MQEKTYDTLWQLFVEMRAHVLQHKSEIVIADDARQLLIGWTAVSANIESDKVFYIRLMSIRTRDGLELPFDNPTISNTFAKLIIDRVGRIQLANMIVSFPEENDLTKALDRMIKLKAFW